MVSLGTMWQFPTVTESFADVDAAANQCIAAINWERWTQCQQTGDEYHPLDPPMVSTIFFLELIRRFIFISADKCWRSCLLVQ